MYKQALEHAVRSLLLKHLALRHEDDGDSDELRRSDRTGVYRSLGISARRLPLLPYVLKEAEVRADGQRLPALSQRRVASAHRRCQPSKQQVV